MATATPGPMIKAIHGRIGNLVFYYSRGTQCIRTHVIPRNPDTEAQRIVRRTFAGAVRSWQAMTLEERYPYRRKARYMNMSGYNLYISEYIKTRISSLSRINTAQTAPDYDLPAIYSNPITSVSKPYKTGYNINPYPEPLKSGPG